MPKRACQNYFSSDLIFLWWALLPLYHEFIYGFMLNKSTTDASDVDNLDYFLSRFVYDFPFMSHIWTEPKPAVPATDLDASTMMSLDFFGRRRRVDNMARRRILYLQLLLTRGNPLKRKPALRIHIVLREWPRISRSVSGLSSRNFHFKKKWFGAFS